MIRQRKKNKGSGAKMNEVKKETYKDPVKKVYACCPFCSATLLQAECVKNVVTKCEQCHQRVRTEIENGIVHVAPYSSPLKKSKSESSKRGLLPSATVLFFMSAQHCIGMPLRCHVNALVCKR